MEHHTFRRQAPRAVNCIAHLLKSIPFKRVPHDEVRLPRRSDKGRYNDQAALRGKKFVAERY
ncbi:MAG TPA: hypothetical protein VNZ53_11510 [Steroidobacteraceae bacterium]|nr:hypothetical protein [Steroidobacteraceae bacterium]